MAPGPSQSNPSSTLGERDLRDRKVDLLRSVRSLTPRQVQQRTRRARYTRGVSADSGEELPDYVDELGVDPARGTETYAEVVLEVDNWRWQGTRFRLRTGQSPGVSLQAGGTALPAGASPALP